MATLVKQSGRYYLQFYSGSRSPNRKRVPLKTGTKRVAERLKVQLEDEYASGNYDPWTDSRPLSGNEEFDSLESAAQAFWEHRSHLAESTQKKSREILRPFLRYLGGDTKPNSVKSSDLRKWLDATETNKVTKESYLRHLRAFFGFLSDRGAISSNPVDEVDLGQVPKKTPRLLSKTEVETIIETVRNHARSAFWLQDVI